jgi:hypothetical protein
MTDALDFRKFVQSDDASDIEKRWERGEYDHISKNEWHQVVEYRAAQIRKSDETKEQAFTRAITSDDLGRVLFKAHQQCNGRRFYKQIFDAPPESVAKAADPTPHLGPAHKEMNALAIDYQRSSGRTFASAYSHVYTNNDNAPLRERVKDEFLRRAMSMGAGGSDLDNGVERGGPGSMTLTEAMALSPAKPFPKGARGN